MSVLYNFVQPISVKDTYSAFNQVDFQVQLKQNSIQKNTFRLVGKLKVTKNAGVALDANDHVFLNAFAGVSSFISAVSVSVNTSQTIESIAAFPRHCAMRKQAKYTLSDLTASSLASVELLGSKNNRLLLGEVAEDGYVTFALKIDNCLNNMLAGDMHPSVVQEVRLMLTLESALNALYVNGVSPVLSLDYLMKDLELHYSEVPAGKVEPIAFETHYLTQQSIVNKITSLSVLTGSSPADKISCSFIKQGNRSNLRKDEFLSEYVSDIKRVEFDVNSSAVSSLYPIESYSDMALNYYRSFVEPNAPMKKNSITSMVTYSTCAFGLGVALQEATNERVSINITFADQTKEIEDDPSLYPIDAFVFMNAFIEL